MDGITIKIELGEKTLASLDRIALALEAKSAPILALEQTIARKPAEEATKAEEPKEEPKVEKPAPAPKTDEKPIEEVPKQTEAPKPEITIGMIRKKVAGLSALGAEKKGQVREVVMSYAKSVSEIPPEKFFEVWERLSALEA